MLNEKKNVTSSPLYSIMLLKLPNQMSELVELLSIVTCINLFEITTELLECCRGFEKQMFWNYGINMNDPGKWNKMFSVTLSVVTISLQSNMDHLKIIDFWKSFK